MTTEKEKLALELRFRPNVSAATWSKLFIALLAWDPRLAPTHVEKTEHYHLEEPERWTSEMWDELAQKCAAEKGFSWTLLNVNEDCAATFNRGLVEVAISIAMPRPAADLTSLVQELINELQGATPPTLAMLFDLYSPQDAEVMSDGLRRLRQVPPILYFDAWAVERVGGRQHLLEAPCETMEIPSGGVLLIVRRSLWSPPSPADIERKQAVEQFFALGPKHPLAFL